METDIKINGTHYKIVKQASETYRIYTVYGEQVRPQIRSFASLKEAFDQIFCIELQS